jgi:hypothetical protein
MGLLEKPPTSLSPIKSSTIHAFESIRVYIEYSHCQFRIYGLNDSHWYLAQKKGFVFKKFTKGIRYVFSAQDTLIIAQNVVWKRTLVELFVSILSVFSSFLDAVLQH